MSSKGPKIGGKEVWVSLKWPENTKIRHPKFVASNAFVDPIWVSPAAAGLKFLPTWSSGRPPPPCPARLQ